MQDFDIILAMRERTAFPRAMFEKLPNLKLMITAGMRNAAIDFEAAKAHNVVLCGTHRRRDPTAPLTMGLILELTRNIGRENARMHAGEPLQKFVGIEIEGRTLGVIGLGKLGTKVATCPGVRHERDRLEPEPDAGEAARKPASVTPPRKSCSQPPTSSPSMWC